jgi:hypothetical protein
MRVVEIRSVRTARMSELLGYELGILRSHVLFEFELCQSYVGFFAFPPVASSKCWCMVCSFSCSWFCSLLVCAGRL